MSIIVISVLVSLLEDLSLTIPDVIIKIVLDHCRRRSEVALCKLVYVKIVVTSEKVVHLLVILGPVPLVVQTSGKSEDS